MTKLLQQALDALLPHSSSHGNSWRPVEDAAIKAIEQALAQQEQPASVDAYVGAREDAAIWKKRALEAEELNRKFIAEVNGPTYLGEPAQQEQPAQEPVMYQYRWTNPGDNKDVSKSDLDWNTVEVRHPADKIESRIEELESSRYNGKPCYEVRGLFARPAPTQKALSESDILEIGARHSKPLQFGREFDEAGWLAAVRAIEAKQGGQQ